MNTTLLVRKDNISQTQLRTDEEVPLAHGQVRIGVEHFAFTSNNITYAALGEAMNYWQFFPTPEPGWGIIPVWGFGTVMQSAHPEVAVGEHLYGYWPMAGSVVLQPERLSAASFRDGAPHRAALHAVYNQYLRSNADPFYTPGSEPEQALLRPLFLTSWLIDDFMADNDFFGAKRMLLSSASSKTAYGTAFQLAQRAGIEVLGLTSPGNRAFCEGLGCYSRVLAYEDLAEIEADEPCVYIDFAGNGTLRRAIHTRFTQLKYNCSIGGTHVDQLGGFKNLPGPRATPFFAPTQIKKRQGDWGPGQLSQRLVQGWQAFLAKVSSPVAPWLVVQQHRGPEEVQAAYAQMLGGHGDPRLGHMLSLR